MINALQKLLRAEHLLCRVDAASKKRCFEIVASHIALQNPVLDEELVYTKLLAREKLGSTGLGNGVAVPHCRVEGCHSPMGYLITLANSVDYDAPDGVAVDLLFVLLAPLQATQEHLDLLADVARCFSDTEFCGGLRSASDTSLLLQAAQRPLSSPT